MGMTERDRKLLAIFAAVIVLGGYWFLVLGKKKDAVAEAEQAKIAAQNELDGAIAAETQGKRAKTRYPVSYSRVVRLGKAIPEDSDYASLVVQVSDISDDEGVRFESLTGTEGDAAPQGASGPTGVVTTCGEGGASSAAGATGTTGASGATTASSGVGQAINDANASAGAASADDDCAAAPTLTDLAAQTAGLKVSTYSFKFRGSFFKLHRVLGRLLHMVRTEDGKVRVTGRLLQINTINLTSSEFPDLTADVQMTSYSLPSTASATAGATPTAPPGAPTPTSAPAS